MNGQRRLQMRINEQQDRWQRLSQKLQGLQQQRDVETRVEEKLRLEKHLKLLKQEGAISDWHDRKISAGSE